MTHKSIIVIFSLVLFLFSCTNDRKLKDKSELNLALVDTLIQDSLVQDLIIQEINKETQIEPVVYDSSFFQNDSIVTAFGIIQSTGITDKHKFKFKAKYQLTTSRKDFYLFTDTDLEKYWGRCVRIKGYFPTGWDINTKEIDGEWTWDRTAIEIISISLLSDTECDYFKKYRPLSQHPSLLKTKKYNDTLSGYIHRTKRMALDISMDYAIILDVPINHPEDSSTKLTSLPIYPNIKLEELNRIIDEKLHITAFGWAIGGYAEMIVLDADSVIIN